MPRAKYQKIIYLGLKSANPVANKLSSKEKEKEIGN